MRVLRKTMDETSFAERDILSYGAKYDSALYGPFNAFTSITEKGMPSEQIEPTDIKSALEKAEADLTEGASALIVKPASSIRRLTESIRQETGYIPNFPDHL
ncbi:MAG: porphobilinogen synthase [Synergistales bacterium]|nr:porphobilinogen synthase [Synergistales bacterium]